MKIKEEDKMTNSNVPKLITSEVIEAVLSNEEALKKLFHLQDEEGFIQGDSCRIAWNSKLIKLLLCDVQIHVKNGDNNSRSNNTNNDNDQAKIHITVADLLNKKNIEAQADEIDKIKESIALMNKEIENIKVKLEDLESFIQRFGSNRRRRNN